MPPGHPDSRLAERLHKAALDRRAAFVELTSDLALLESPGDHAELQQPVFDRLSRALERTGMSCRRYPAGQTGGILLAAPADRTRGTPFQVLLGHADTVWPTGTLVDMPVILDGDSLRGPGTFDMKGGLAMAAVALEVLGAVGARPAVTPVLLVNSDEEMDSAASRDTIRRVARRADRVLVLEPGQGPDGRLKSGRPGTALYHVTVNGRAAHAGLAPHEGRSAILAMADLVRDVSALHDPGRGILVNVGTVHGGTRRNVIPAECRFTVDVRTATRPDAERLDARLRDLSSPRDGISVSVEGAIERPPFEGTIFPHRYLLDRALELASLHGADPGHGYAGGASDGNFTAEVAPTVDGLGAVGAGAHAAHEHVAVDLTVRRIAWLAHLLLEPALRPESTPTP